MAQFFENYASALEMVGACVAQLGWPELEERYSQCFKDYIHVNGNDATLKQWREHRKRERERYRNDARKIVERNSGKKFSGDMDRLDWYVMAFSMQGEITVQSWDYATIDAFNPWFWSDAVKDASCAYVGEFVRRRRDELVRLVG